MKFSYNNQPTLGFGKKKTTSIISALAATLIFTVSCEAQSNQTQKEQAKSEMTSINKNNNSKLLLKLPQDYNTPDGLAISDDGNLILSVPNFNNKHLLKNGTIQKAAPKFMAIIDKDNHLSHWYDFKKEDLHPTTGQVGPMDCAFGPDGNLYVADMQVFFSKKHLSRILRINVVNGKPTSVDVVVEGFIASNGLFWRGDQLFVTESVLEEKENALISGVYSFSINELQKKSPIKLKPHSNGQGDRHLVETFISDKHMGFGADGVTFDDKGFMYTTVIEAGKIYKSKLDANNKAVETKLFAQAPQMKGPDGLIFSKEQNAFFVADFLNNAVHKIDRDGKVITLQQNGDFDGSHGKLDQPAEVILRGNELIIVNMDMAWATPNLSVNTKVDNEYNLSKIDLK